MSPRLSGLRCRMDLISRNFLTPVLVAMVAIIIVVAMHMHDPDAEDTGVYFSPYRIGLAWCGCFGLAACAVLALEDAGRIGCGADAGPPCVVLALGDAGPPRTSYRYPLSSLLYCVGLLGWQLLAVLHRTTSSAEQLRGSTALLRASGRSLLPPFAIVGAVYFVLGFGLGFQQLPLLCKLQVACFEIALFTHSPRLDITRSRYGAPEPPERLIGRG